MAQGRRPRGIEDDIAKKIARLLKSGKKADKMMAQHLDELLQRQSGLKKQIDYQKGKSALIKEWDRKLGADFYIQRERAAAKNRGQIAAAESRNRGFQKKVRSLGARQQANPSQAISDAATRQQKRVNWVKSGGVNAPKKVQKRLTAREAASQAVRKDAKSASKRATNKVIKKK